MGGSAFGADGAGFTVESATGGADEATATGFDTGAGFADGTGVAGVTLAAGGVTGSVLTGGTRVTLCDVAPVIATWAGASWAGAAAA